MPAVYDNWERLVAAVLKREQLRQLCRADSIATSISSLSFSSRFSFSSLDADVSASSRIQGQSEDFKLKDYCPMVCRDLREMFKIDEVDYTISACGDDALRQLSSPGKSGTVFFQSQDDRFMFKLLRNSEVKILLKLLPNYQLHVRTYENTLIIKFFGLHRITTPSSGKKIRFGVMRNIFCTELRIHRKFELKGSSLGRSAATIEIDENTMLKDLDLNYCFFLESSRREALLHQIEIDSRFLKLENIMDYSLSLGVHYRAPNTQSMSEDGLGILAEDGTSRPQTQLGVNMPARAEQIPGNDGTEMFHEVYDVVLYLGIIDILQEYNMSKKIERAYKSMQFDPLSISAVDPTFYSDRFLEFIQKVFPPNAALDQGDRSDVFK
ncbi:hypothetical protein CASFOL_013440 [Castilleja foliolosa]|uniref:1-phosphatidylinositol-4-phosphate 5-kinase n=1 Tax=Castilleja foliolosa TaxID=1961234 RepID=A0ABD3DP17_9LAMI